jgi:sigma-E factor negative regulatory protein RseB
MQIIKQNLRRVSITGEPAEYMLLSDGLVDVSVYVMSANDAINEDLSVISGTTSVVSISDGRIQVTVVGEIPAVTANKIANSIVLVSAQVLPQSMPQEQSQEQLGS